MTVFGITSIVVKLHFVLFYCHQESAGDLMVRNIQLKHSGKYVCMVHTVVDSVSAAADLIVRGTHALPHCDATLYF